MSRGPGRVRRSVLAALQAQPQRRWTIEELAALVYGTADTALYHLNSVHRALKGVPVVRRWQYGKVRYVVVSAE